MAPRAYWTGHLRLSLVSLPVRLYAATSGTHRLALHQVHRETGERVRQQLIVPDHGPVAREDVAKGYEYERGRYVLLEQADIDDLKVESKKTIEVVQFADADEIDPIYYEKPYFVTPDGALANEAFVVVRDALRDARKVGLGQIVIGGREHVAAIRPCGRGLLLETLRYADEVRNADLYFQDIEDLEADEDQLDLARELIRRKTSPFDPERFKDRYQEALKDLVKAKVEKRPAEPESPAPRRGGNVVNLMEALKRSLKVDEDAGSGKEAKSRAPRGKTAAIKETSAKAKTPKAPAKSAPRRRKSA
ncbi:MAG: Ku protein [Alphaproteobacteria bacterium]